MKNKILLSLILAFLSQSWSIVSFAQVSNPNNNWSAGAYCGWNSANDLDFKVGAPTLYMTLKASGDLNMAVATNGYMINNNYVLRHNGNTSDIFVGVGAGNSNATNANTFVGYNAGLNSGNTSGINGEGTRNTFVGHASGSSNDRGQENSFFGDSSGFSTIGTSTSGYHNTFLGASCGWSNVSGKSNTFIGYKTGYNCLGDYNTMTGRAAGYGADGFGNCYYGKDAAQGIHTADASGRIIFIQNKF